eukprot:374942-Amphidinium_carterae.1
MQYQPQNSQNFGQQQAQTMQELRQPAPTFTSAAASVTTVQSVHLLILMTSMPCGIDSYQE